MTETDLNSHVEDILNILNKDSKETVEKGKVEEELKKFMNYGVPMDQAKQTLIKKFGGGSVKFDSAEEDTGRTLIENIESNHRSVNLLGKIITINPKEITVKGEKRRIFYGIIGDESRTIPFTYWKDEADIEKGDIVEVKNAYTREWQGKPQLNFGDRVKIEKTDEERLPESAFEPREKKIKELKSGMASVEVKARVVDVEEREAEVGDEKKKVISGIIGDETGKAQFTSWYDYDIKKGDVLKISGGYVKMWKGIPQLTFDKKADVDKLDGSKIPKEKIGENKLTLDELVEKGGGLDVDVTGTVIDIKEGSGVVERCPECNRVLQDGECNIHGDVKGEEDLRVKLVVDDGRGAVNTVLNKELTEKIIGKSLEECKSMDEEELKNIITDALFAKQINLKGNALGDEFGTTIIPRDAEMVSINLEEEAEEISEEVKDLL